MRITELTAIFEQVDGTSLRHVIVQVLANLFRRGASDVDVLVYLLQGRLGPLYASPDLGVDERRIIAAIGEAANVAPRAIEQRYQSLGDLGLVAAELLPPVSDGLTVRAVFQTLLQIASVTGPTSATEKVALLCDLLRRLGGPDARYVVRIADGKLRLGVGDATILDALSVASAGDRSLRSSLERAYNYSSDLGLVARTLLTRGPASLAEIHPTPGRPVRSALAERLPSADAVVRTLGRVILEPKYDGLRLQAQKDGDQVWLFTRNLENVTDAFPEVVAAVRSQVRSSQVVLDGEAAGYDPRTSSYLSFQQTMRRRRKHGVAEMAERYPLRYFVFDVLSINSQDQTVLPQVERSRRLREIIAATPDATIQVAPQTVTDDPATIDNVVTEMVNRGLEGAMAKRLDAPYSAGTRQFAWVKLKREYREAVADTFDVVVVGYDRGHGKRARLGIGSLLGAVYDSSTDRFRTITKVGSGLTDAEWVRLREMLDAVAISHIPKRVDSTVTPDVWVTPQYVVEVVAAEITRSPNYTCGKVGRAPGYSLRFPRVIRFRFDRGAEDATTEQEVLELYNLRSGRQSGSSKPAATGLELP